MITYRHRYNSTLKNLPVTEEYLLEAFQTILEFAQFVSKEAQSIILKGPDKPRVKRAEIRRGIVLEVLSEEVNGITGRDFHYSVDDNIGCLGDILVSYQVEEPKQILVSEGSRADVRAYMNILKKLERKNQVIIHEKESIWSRSVSRPRECKLPREMIESIAKSLPKRPWPQYLHKQIASSLGISNAQASAAITVILSDDTLAAMIDGEEEIR